MRTEVLKNRSAQCFEENQTLADQVEQGTDLSARHYGAASFSFPKLLKSLLGSSKRGNLSECGLIGAVLQDTVHPSVLGRLLLADIFTLYLAKAQKYYHANKGQLGLPHHQRVQPLYSQSMVVPRMTCYGMAAFSVRHQSHDDASDTKVALLPVFYFSDGWEFIEVEHDKRKPGWISHKPGSILRMAVEVEIVSPGVRQTIGLSFLTSYEHMGIAILTCIQGCQCPDKLMDGHERVHRHSVPQMTTIQPKWEASAVATSVTNATKRSCVLQVEILDQTSSGGHKFKVLQLMVTSWVNVADYFNSSRSK